MSKENRIVKKIRKLEIKLIKLETPVYIRDIGGSWTETGNPTSILVIKRKLQYLRADLEEARKPKPTMWDEF